MELMYVSCVGCLSCVIILPTEWTLTSHNIWLCSKRVPKVTNNLASAVSLVNVALGVLVQQVLNEVVVDRGPSSYLSNVDLFLDGHLITTVQGDGE